MAIHTTKMLIIGSGPAGLSAAIYGARAGMEPIVVQGLQPGGQLTITTDVENYPGFRDVIQGPWLMEEMQAQAEHVGTRMLWDTITSVDLTGPKFTATGDGGDIYEGDTLVIATGAQAKWLGAPGEQELGGKGVSACATCDGFFYRGKKVAVIGGGNTAVEEALYLTNHSDDVTLIHRRDSLRAEKILQDRLFANPKISVLWNKTVQASRRARTVRLVRCGWSILRRLRKAHLPRKAPSSQSATRLRQNCSRASWRWTRTAICWSNRARPRQRSPACLPAAT